MTGTNRIVHIIKNEWVISAFLLIIFFLTNGYTLGWDDQHLEIPLLKSLIDPTLYVGDYYIESLRNNFPSLLFPLLARIIRIEQIPMTYLLLFLLSRYFLFWGMFRLWLEIGKSRLSALLCVVMLIVVGRVDEFLYRTFSHQEFALAIIFLGIYLFYKERFVLASAVLGIGANIHALYCFFPFFYLSTYLLWSIRRYRLIVFVKSCLAFLLCATPVVLWKLGRHALSLAGTPEPANWIGLYQIACPQNFLFFNLPLQQIFTHGANFLNAMMPYALLIVYYLLNLIHNPRFRADSKVQVTILSGFGLLAVSFVFTYLLPSRFVLDLNLIRNTQFILFFLMGYTTLLLLERTEKAPWGIALGVALLFPLIHFLDYMAILTGFALIFLIGLGQQLDVGPKRNWRSLVFVFLFLGLMLSIGGIIQQFLTQRYGFIIKISLAGIGFFLLANFLCHFFVRQERTSLVLRRLLIIIPLIGYTANFMFYHHRHLLIERTGTGFWQLQRNWIDMQKFVHAHTPKNALFLIPNDMEMGGFRIFAERKVICDYRDCGIIGFDFPAAVEWQKRLQDISAFKVAVEEPVTTAIMNAIFKYKVNYIIFMNYLNPGASANLKPIYRNEAFSLYQVISNPVPESSK
jgi:hypothetical protein